MKEIFTKLKDTLNNGENCVLCSIINSSGSAPRGAGAKMLVLSDKSFAGTIGGGKVEYKALEMAYETLSTKKFKTQEFNLNKDDVLDLGMVCGGNVTVYFRYFTYENQNDKELAEYVCSILDKEENVWLITDVEKNKGQIGTYCNSDGIKFIDLSYDDIKPNLTGKAYLNKGNFFIEPLVRRGYVYIFGGGHVSQALVPVISKIGFRPIVLEDREKFTNKDLFSGVVDTKLVDFNNLDLDITSDDYIVIMTRGHQADFEILEFALKSEASYIGLIGSKHKWQKTTEMLKDDGFIEKDWNRVYNPIGLDILAETPDEIAISIAAEMIKYRAENA